jgi:pyridoxine/pyridoxamine 5'-phosphate oxidase
MMVPAARIDSLPLIEVACWHTLAEAAAERTHEWRMLVLATVDGDRASARTVMLREVDRESRELVFFTDSRSPKVAQIALHPRGTLLAW